MSEHQKFVAIRETESHRAYPTRPSDIYVGPGCLLSSFGAAEIEQEAERLILFFQERGYWSAFSMSELDAFYKQRGFLTEHMLGGLYSSWFHPDTLQWYEPEAPYVVQHEDNLFSATDLFINRCIKAVDPQPFLAMLDHVTEIVKGVRRIKDTRDSKH